MDMVGTHHGHGSHKSEVSDTMRHDIVPILKYRASWHKTLFSIFKDVFNHLFMSFKEEPPVALGNLTLLCL